MVNEVKNKTKGGKARVCGVLMYSVTSKDRHSVVQDDGSRGRSRNGAEEKRNSGKKREAAEDFD